jgi:hypothetical protein
LSDEFYEAGKIGKFLPSLGEMKVHPKVYAEIQRGEHQETLKPVLSQSWGEWDVIVTTEIPADRIVFIIADAQEQDELLHIALLPTEEELEMREIERLRKLIAEQSGE